VGNLEAFFCNLRIMDTDVEQPSSLVFVQASELFPKKALESGLLINSCCAYVT